MLSLSERHVSEKSFFSAHGKVFINIANEVNRVSVEVDSENRKW